MNTPAPYLTTFNRLGLRAWACSAALLLGTATAWAQVSIQNPWVRGTVAQQQASGAFMQLSSNQELRLLSAQSPVAGVVELHEMVMQDNVMKMRQIPGLDLMPGRVLELKPGGYHIMLINLKQQLKGDDMVPLTLTFEDVKTKKTFTQDIKAPVKALGAASSPMHSGH